MILSDKFVTAGNHYGDYAIIPIIEEEAKLKAIRERFPDARAVQHGKARYYYSPSVVNDKEFQFKIGSGVWYNVNIYPYVPVEYGYGIVDVLHPSWSHQVFSVIWSSDPEDLNNPHTARWNDADLYLKELGFTPIQIQVLYEGILKLYSQNDPSWNVKLIRDSLSDKMKLYILFS